MKPKPLMIVALLWVLSFCAFSQYGPPPGGGTPPKPKTAEERIEEEVKWMKKKLKLTEEQIVEVSRISEKYAYAQQDLMKLAFQGGRSGGRENFRAGLEKLTADKDAEMKEVLDDAQYKKYLKRREDPVKEMENRPSGGPGQGRGPGGGPGGMRQRGM